MRFDHLAYWLQGHYEFQKHYSKETLAETGKPKNVLTSTQVACIKNHIQLHYECCLREDIDPDQFVCWLEGALGFYDALPYETKEELVVELQERLDKLFVHKIDPQLPGDKDSLQDIHDGKKDGKGEDKLSFGKFTGRGKALEKGPHGRDGRGRRLMC